MKMSFLAILLITLVLAIFIWRVFAWFTKAKSTATNSTTVAKENSTLTTTQQEITAVSPSEIKDGRDVAKQQSNFVEINNSSELVKNLQLELSQERSKCHSAEDWAEFLCRELDAQINGCIEAERRYSKLLLMLDSAGHTDLSGNLENVLRRFKDSNEARLTWQKNWTEKEKTPEKQMTEKLELENNEWNQIVQTNLRILQMPLMYEKRVPRNSNRKSGTGKNQVSNQDGQTSSKCKLCHKNQNGSGSLVDIAIDECITPIEQQKRLGTGTGENSGAIDFHKLTIPLQSQGSNNHEQTSHRVLRDAEHTSSSSDTAEADNPLVCTDSLCDIKKTKQLWEGLIVSGELPETAAEFPSPSPGSASALDRKSLSDSCSDITTGLVKKNLELWENNENVESSGNP